MRRNLQYDQPMTQPPDTTGTTSELPPELRYVSNGLLDDHPTGTQMTQRHLQESPEASLDSSISNDSNAKIEALPCSDQTSALPNEFFSISRYLNNQRVDGWIDDADSHGGRLVRAAISNATPAVWMQALSGRAHFVGRTYHMEQSMLEERAGNPKQGCSPRRNRVRRAARQRTKSRERGE